MIGSSLDTLELKLVSVHCCWHAEVAVARTFVSFGFKVIGCQSQNVALWLLVLARKRLNCKEDIDIVSLCAVWLPFSYFWCQFFLFVLVGKLAGSVATWWSFEMSVYWWLLVIIGELGLWEDLWGGQGSGGGLKLSTWSDHVASISANYHRPTAAIWIQQGDVWGHGYAPSHWSTLSYHNCFFVWVFLVAAMLTNSRDTAE